MAWTICSFKRCSRDDTDVAETTFHKVVMRRTRCTLRTEPFPRVNHVFIDIAVGASSLTLHHDESRHRQATSATRSSSVLRRRTGRASPLPRLRRGRRREETKVVLPALWPAHLDLLRLSARQAAPRQRLRSGAWSSPSQAEAEAGTGNHPRMWDRPFVPAAPASHHQQPVHIGDPTAGPGNP